MEIQNILESIRKHGVEENLIEDLETRLLIIQHKLKHLADKPRVALLTGDEPFQFENSLEELIRFVGGKPVQAENWNELQVEDPEILIIAFKGKSIEQSLGLVGDLLAKEQVQSLYATKANQIFIVDGAVLEDLRGDKLIDTIELLAEVVHSKQFYFGFQGEKWLKMEL